MNPLTFVSYDDFKVRVANILGKNPAELAKRWTTSLQDSLASAYNDIVSRLSNRGFSPAQISNWDRGPEFNVDIGLFWCVTKGGIPSHFSDVQITKLDRRKELDDVLFTVNQLEQVPAQTGFLAAVSNGPQAAIGVGYGMSNAYCQAAQQVAGQCCAQPAPRAWWNYPGGW